MSVIGIDFGNESCYIAVARAGGIETIANDFSLRATPSCVAFGEKNRLLGVSAKNQQVTNIKNTIHSFKRLLGRKFDDPSVKEEMPNFPFALEDQNRAIKIKVQYGGETVLFSPEQITAMLFTKLKETAETALRIKVTDCVISVPAYFTDVERRALLDAAQIAGLNVLRLLNETTAAALCYGIYKQDLPAPEEKPRVVVFVDMGHSSLQVCSVEFNKAKLKMLACVCDRSLGGRDIDEALAQYFSDDFKTRFKVDPRTNPRAYLRLLTEVEKLKKQMSANSTTLPISIECFMDEKDVSSKMNRATMEGMIEGLLSRLEKVFKQLLKDSKVKLDDIYAVELIGASTRIPSVKNLIQKIFNKEPSATLNQDEAVARGCALQCAMLSPNFKVREFSITDLQLYPINLYWSGEKTQEGSDEVFPRYHPFPFSKQLTFFRKEPFNFEAHYSEDVPFPDKRIGKFAITKVVPNQDGESSKVKVKVRINLHGIFNITSACIQEQQKGVPENGEPMQVDQESATQEDLASNANAANDNSGDNEKSGNSTPKSEGETPMQTDQQSTPKNENDEGKQNKEDAPNEKKSEQPSKKSKTIIKQVELPIERFVPQLNKNTLDLLVEQELKMIAGDRQEKERIDAKNAVEEYVYEMRDKIGDQLSPYIADQDKEKFMALLGLTENWLYEGGDEESKNVYVEKLTELRKFGEPVRIRRREHEERPRALEELGAALQLARKALEQYAAKDEKYSHITPEEMAKVNQAVGDKQAWYEVASKPFRLIDDPPYLVEQIRKEKKFFDDHVNATLGKPKPKPPEPPKEASPPKDDPKRNEGPTDSSNAQQQQQQQPGAGETTNMDVEN